MRRLTIAFLCLGAAACGGGQEEKKAEETPAMLPAGTWTIASEVTAMRSTDKTTPAVKAAVGDKDSDTVCVDKASKTPPPELFAGKGYQCSYSTSYMKEGTINATMDCRRAGLKGSIPMTVQGTYTAKGFNGTVDATSYLTGDGDFAMTRKLSATVKPGACTAAPAGEDDDAEDATTNAG